MGVELFGVGKNGNRFAQFREPLRRHFLHRHTLGEVGEPQAGVSRRAPVGGQNVIGAGGVVTARFG